MISDSPELGGIIQAHIRAALANVYVCQPAVLTAFDQNTQRGTFDLLIAPFVANRVTGETTYTDEPTRVHDVPVLAFGSLTGGLLWSPPVVGETALLFFCDRSIAEVKSGAFTSGSATQPMDVGALHDVMDAFAIITPNISAPYQDVVKATIASTGPVLYAPTGKVVNLSHPNPSHFAALADIVMDNLNELRTKVNALIDDFTSHVHGGVTTGSGSSGGTMTLPNTVNTMADVASSKVKLN